MIVSDNGTELTSMAILRWSQHTRIEWHYIAPGKPQQNAFVESFNGRLRDELLNETLFASLGHARELLAELAGRLQHRSSAQRDRQPAAINLCQATAPDMQRDGTLRCVEGSAPRPVASPSQQAQMSQDSTHRWMIFGAQVTQVTTPNGGTIALRHAARDRLRPRRLSGA